MVYDGKRDERERYGADYGYSSARDYEAAGGRRDDRGPYGRREYGNERYGQRERMNRGQGGFERGYDRDDGRSGGYGGEPYRGAYAGDGRPFADYDRDDRGRGDDRGFLARAGDEVRSWFGGDDDDRGRGRGYDGTEGRRVRGDWRGDRVHDHRDRHYHDWREGQIAALDRDYEEYRREHQSRFENEFATWRSGRQSQRDMLSKVDEHQEVVGSDGAHVGTVDKVRGDRIVLTKNDADAGGRHHSVPSSWLRSVENGTVTLSKSAAEAKAAWRDEERRGDDRGAMFGGEKRDEGGRFGEDDQARDNQGRILNRSFSGTYD